MIRLNDIVDKRMGYEFHSIVVAVFVNQANEQRLVCESLVIPGLLRIFSPDQMRKSD